MSFYDRPLKTSQSGDYLPHDKYLGWHHREVFHRAAEEVFESSDSLPGGRKERQLEAWFARDSSRIARMDDKLAKTVGSR